MMGAFNFFLYDLVFTLALISVISILWKKKILEKIELKHLIATLLITKISFLLFKISTNTMVFDADVEWYYLNGSQFISGKIPQMEYPQFALLIFSFNAFLSGGLNNFRIVFPLFQLFFGVVIIAFFYKIALLFKNKIAGITSALVYCFTPSILWFWLFRFDEIAIALCLAAIYFFIKKRYFYSGTLCALGTATKWFPLFLVPTFFIYFLNERKSASYFIISLFIFLILIFAPFYFVDSEKFVYTYKDHFNRTILGESLYYSIESIFTGEHIQPYESPKPPMYFKNEAVFLIFIIGFVLWFCYLLRKVNIDNYAQFSALTILLFIILNKIHSVQYIIWGVPLFLFCFITLKLKEKSKFLFFLIIMVLLTFNWLKGLGMRSENWIYVARLFWLIYIGLFCYILIKINKKDITSTPT
jgi:Gpi18-like mannosyltransferase